MALIPRTKRCLGLGNRAIDFGLSVCLYARKEEDGWEILANPSLCRDIPFLGTFPARVFTLHCSPQDIAITPNVNM